MHYRRTLRLSTFGILAFAASSAIIAHTAMANEFTVKREAVFEFVQPPRVSRQGDAVTIAFESKAFCDATVAIEHADGRILRHLASGVLGDNAPPPFKKSSKAQTVLWDGKDDAGKYVDDKDSLTVRVSLGLKPQFERTMFANGTVVGALTKRPWIACARNESPSTRRANGCI